MTISAVLVACAAALVAFGVNTTACAENVRIGVLTELGGPYADLSGQGAVEAARMAADDLAPQLGTHHVDILSADEQGKPDIGTAIARRWLDEQDVDAIANVPNSAVALSVQGMTRERRKIFLITGASSADLSGKSCSPYTAHWTDDAVSLSRGTTRAVIARGDAKTWFFITVDYSAGRSLAEAARTAVDASGGKVVGEVLTPIGTTDFSSALLQAQASGAQVVALMNAGADTINSIKQAHEFNLTGHGQALVAVALFITDVHALGLDTAQGLMFTTGFYWDRTDASRAWSRRFFDKIGRMPTREQAETYSAVRHYLRGIIATNSTDGARVMAWMKANPVDDFYAPGARLREDGRLVRDIYLAQVKSPAQSRQPWDYYTILSTLPGDQAFRSMAEGGCPYVAN